MFTIELAFSDTGPWVLVKRVSGDKLSRALMETDSFNKLLPGIWTRVVRDGDVDDATIIQPIRAEPGVIHYTGVRVRGLCDCGAPFVLCNDGNVLCERTAETFKARYGHYPTHHPKG